MPAKVDIAVIGTGYAGVSSVYHMLQSCKERNTAPPSIVFLEARQACSGATGRNGKEGNDGQIFRGRDTRWAVPITDRFASQAAI